MRSEIEDRKKEPYGTTRDRKTQYLKWIPLWEILTIDWRKDHWTWKYGIRIYPKTSTKSIQTAKHFINFIILNGLTFVARVPEGEERGWKEKIFKEGMVKNF